MYKTSFFLTENIGNNALSFEARSKLHVPKLYVPSLIDGGLSDVQIGDEVVFEDFEDDKLKSCVGLKNFVKIGKSYVFDNHNHAFYFWHSEATNGNLRNGSILVHIDGHRDNRIPPKMPDTAKVWSADLSKEEKLKYVFEYTNFVLNVGNFIPAAVKTGLIGEVINVLSEKEIDEFDYAALQKKLEGGERDLVLDVDLDFFASELDYIPSSKKLALIKALLPLAKTVTFASSPFFIEQEKAIFWLSECLKNV